MAPEIPSDLAAQLAAHLATELSGQLAGTREDLARFEGRVTARLAEMDNSIVVLADEVTRQEKALQGVAAQLQAMQVRRESVEEYRARQRRWWDKAREWLAYLTALGAVVWNVFQSRNGGG